ncbi:hypothetical protein ABE137_06690 [Brevibacillus laterosporus]|uniref:hypothetical protein n=1 Tax=Brevibacillus laterosporus TaxID=1465 RepID=UPI003D213F7A
MFRQVYGFDPDVFKVGQAIQIVDTGFTRELKNGNVYLHYYQDMTGIYLIEKVDVLTLELTRVPKGTVTMPIRHFTGENPRMTIRILE